MSLFSIPSALLRRIGVAAVAVILCITFIWSELPRGTVDIWFLNGEATIIREAHSVILVDGGPSTLLSELGKALPVYDRTIDLIIVMHTDDSHLSGLIDVVRRYDVRSVLLSTVPNSSAAYEVFLNELKLSRIPVLFAEKNPDLDRGGIHIQIFPIASQKSPFAVRASFQSSVLFADTDTQSGDVLATVGTSLRSTILRTTLDTPTNWSPAFLNAVKPELTVISNRLQNRYDRIDPELLEPYERIGSQIYSTSTQGTLHVECGPEKCRKLR